MAPVDSSAGCLSAEVSMIDRVDAARTVLADWDGTAETFEGRGGSTPRIRIEVDPESGRIKRPPSYRDTVSMFGDVVAETEWGGYEGDTLWMLKGAQGYGIPTFGWGSCSGCDALEACYSQADFDLLQVDLERGLRWFPTLGEAVAFVAGGGLKDSYLDDDMIAAFVKASTTVVVAEGTQRKAVES